VLGAIFAGLVYYLIDLPWDLSWQFFGPYAKELPFIKPITSFLAFLMLRWPLISLFQWSALRRSFRQTWLWPMVTTLATGLWALITLSFSFGKTSAEFLVMNILCGCVLIGLGQGLCLACFKPKESSKQI
jgi:hypothetical protein